MELYCAFFKILRHNIRNIIIYILILLGLIVLLTFQIQNIKYANAVSMTEEYEKIWEDYIETEPAGVTFHLYSSLDVTDSRELKLYYFFNYVAFSIMSITATGIAIMLAEFQNDSTDRRIRSALVQERKLLFLYMSAGLMLVIGIWSIHILAAICLLGRIVFSMKGMLAALNMLALAVSAHGFANLSMQFIKNKKRIGITINMLILIMCLISGVFTPQYLLGDTAKAIAVLMPTYWYVKAGDIISSNQFIETFNYVEIIRYIVIQFLFAIAMYVIALVISKAREDEAGGALKNV